MNRAFQRAAQRHLLQRVRCTLEIAQRFAQRCHFVPRAHVRHVLRQVVVQCRNDDGHVVAPRAFDAVLALQRHDVGRVVLQEGIVYPFGAVVIFGRLQASGQQPAEADGIFLDGPAETVHAHRSEVVIVQIQRRQTHLLECCQTRGIISRRLGEVLPQPCLAVLHDELGIADLMGACVSQHLQMILALDKRWQIFVREHDWWDEVDRWGRGVLSERCRSDLVAPMLYNPEWYAARG
mmetsp:Transcript_22934/g.64982  ORF Transcript_22934/g.64982 Transcript_22934/m.64982 type:complete len:236 (-) Transcript_22934:19-726(-)